MVLRDAEGVFPPWLRGCFRRYAGAAWKIKEIVGKS